MQGVANQAGNDEPKVTLHAVWSSLFAAFAGLWQYGYSVGSINALYKPVTKALRIQYKTRYGMEISDETIKAIWTVCSAAFPVGGIFGALLVGPVVRRFGRLRGMLLGHFVTIVMSLLCGLSEVIGSPEAIIIGRIGIGVSSAVVGLGISTMYIVEVSPKHLRGFFGGMISVSIAFGIMMANIFGLPEVLGSDRVWNASLALAGAPSLLYVICFKTFAPSPRKLFIEDGAILQATAVLRRLKGVENVSKEIAELEKEKRLAKSVRQLTVLELIACKKLRRAVLSTIVLGASQHICGLHGVSTNLNNIYIVAGIGPHLVQYISIGVQGCVVIIQLFSSRFTEWYGRKYLLIIGYSVQAFCLTTLVVSMETQSFASGMAYVSVVASLGFWIGFSIGPGPVTILVVAESFDQIARSAAVTLATLAVWVCFTTTVVVTPYMLNYIRGYTFVPFAILSAGAALYVRFYVPETKNRSFAEIQSFNGIRVPQAPQRERQCTVISTSSL